MTLPNNKIEQLPMHERLAVIVIISFLIGLAVLTWRSDPGINQENLGSPHYIVEPIITVTINGAVQHPGCYKVKRGMTVQELISLAGPNERAFIEHYKLDAKLRNNQKFNIPEKKKELKKEKYKKELENN